MVDRESTAGAAFFLDPHRLRPRGSENLMASCASSGLYCTVEDTESVERNVTLHAHTKPHVAGH